jgi:hypothetical protein
MQGDAEMESSGERRSNPACERVRAAERVAPFPCLLPRAKERTAQQLSYDFSTSGNSRIFWIMQVDYHFQENQTSVTGQAITRTLLNLLEPAQRGEVVCFSAATPAM